MSPLHLPIPVNLHPGFFGDMSSGYLTYLTRQVQAMQSTGSSRTIVDNIDAFTLDIPFSPPPSALVLDRRLCYCRGFTSARPLDQECFFRRDNYSPAENKPIATDDSARHAHVQRRPGIENFSLKKHPADKTCVAGGTCSEPGHSHYLCLWYNDSDEALV